MAVDVVMIGDGEINRRGLWWWWLRAGLTVVVVAMLAIDAFRSPGPGFQLRRREIQRATQGDLFRAEAALAIIAALALVVRPAAGRP